MTRNKFIPAIVSKTGRAALRTEDPVIWKAAPALVPYADALADMEARVTAIAAGDTREQVWLLEHPPLYTAGTSAKPADLVDPDRFPVFDAGRGGQYTYHGPGQRVAYLMLDLRQRGRDIRCFVSGVEQLVIDTLAEVTRIMDEKPGVVMWADEPVVPLWNPLTAGHMEQRLAAEYVLLEAVPLVRRNIRVYARKELVAAE